VSREVLAKEFPSMLFPKDRTILYPFEVAAKLRCDVRHVFDLIEEAQIRAVNISGGNNRSNRRQLRIPIESWEAFVVARMV
jgi:hypothetical protein